MIWRAWGNNMRYASVIFILLIVSIAPATAQYPQYRRGGPPPVQEECPQARQIRAQKAYPPTMTDCEVLDADTAAQNNQLRQRAVAPPVAQQITSPPRSFSQEQIRGLLDRQNAKTAAPVVAAEPSTLVSDPPATRVVPAAIFTDNLKDPTGQKGSGWIWVVFSALALYFMPAIIAANRNHHNTLAISALNLFLGWSFLGWVAAFVWACTKTEKHDRSEVLVVRQETRL
jgi:hypothetical protein